MSTGLALNHRTAKLRIAKKRSTAVSAILGLLLGHGAIVAQKASEKTNPDSQETVYDAGRGGVRIPKAIYQPNPEYSEKARRKKLQGTVMVGMVVSADGTVRDVNVVQSLEPSLDKQAIACVSKWRFQPATKDGNPVAAHLKVEVDFHLY